MDNGQFLCGGADLALAKTVSGTSSKVPSDPKKRQRQSASSKASTFRVGKVRGDLRGRVWYLTYHEHGIRQRPRVGRDLAAAKQLAAQINGQLASDAPAALSYRPVSLHELRSSWLDHHEHVARSSIQTVRRYRAATEHLERFLNQERVPRSTAHFRLEHAEKFVKYLRSIQVHPNGHAKSATRPLLDKGIKFILEACRAMFSYAVKHRHLSPYADNPFQALEVDRLPVEDSKPIVLLTEDQEAKLLEACDDWQLPIFATLLFTGIRPGELCHLLLPHDIDWDAGLLRIRNKPRLGWQVKTRDEREIPLIEPLLTLLRRHVGDRTAGPVFLQRRYSAGRPPEIGFVNEQQLQRLVEESIEVQQSKENHVLGSKARLCLQKSHWRIAGALRPERIRNEFIRCCQRVGLSGFSCVKVLRHQFATALQEGNVDPLIRCELMGHSTSGKHGGGLGMTARYTHSRTEIKRFQLWSALAGRCALQMMARPK
jgi:integrase